MKLNKIIFIIIIISSTLAAQHYITSGIGVAGSSVSSDKMDGFRKTYNQTNKLFLSDKFEGFNFGLGLRPEFGYRYINEFSTAVLIGYQTFTDFDIANFSNGETRKLRMDLTAFWLEYDFGYNWGDFFTNGLLTFYFNRKVVIKNTYKTDDLDFISSFTGTFKGRPSNSLDFGFAVGVVKSFFLIVLKASYPLYTGGKSDVLTDSKLEEDVKRFPADYNDYTQSNPYPGVTSDIDGIKIILTISFAFKLNDI